MREYRIIQKGNLFYPQVRETDFFLKLIPYKTKWKRIARHPDGYGLYDGFEYGESLIKVEAFIDNYEEYKRKLSTEKAIIFGYYTKK